MRRSSTQSTAGANSGRPRCRRRDRTTGRHPARKLAYLIFAPLLLLATVVASFHFHNDFKEHADCAICVVAHHHAVSSNAETAVIADRTTFSEAIYPVPATASLHCPLPDSVQPRAPPSV